MKLIKICKFFVAKHRVIVVEYSSFFFIDDEKVEISLTKEKLTLSKKKLEKSLIMLWIINEIQMVFDVSMSVIYRFDGEKIAFSQTTMKFKNYLKLIASKNLTILEMDTMRFKDEDGVLVSAEDILKPVKHVSHLDV